MKAGYSGTPLAKKLGIKYGFKISLINQPDYYFKLFTDLPPLQLLNDSKTKKDFIHFFIKDAATLNKEIQKLKKEIEPNGMIWISWPKKSSKIQSDITENIVRSIALRNDLVDIKVCAIDKIWSGLKLVIPVKQRK